MSRREGVDLLVLDEEFLPLATGLDVPHGIWRAWADSPRADTLDSLIATADGSTPPRPHRATLILLTSGTTGIPKGAPRSELRTLTPIGAIFGRVPFRVRGVTECAAPMFHALGAVHAVLAVALGSTLILRRRFDPAATLDGLARHRVSALIVVPIMLRRILALGPAPSPGAIFRPAHRFRRRLPARRRPVPAGHGGLRARAVQPVRVD